MKIKAVILDFYGVIYSNFDWSAIDERIQSDELKAQRFAYLKNQSNIGKLGNTEFCREVAKLADDALWPDRPAALAEPHVNSDLVSSIKQVLPGVTIALLSNGNRDDVIGQLTRSGLVGEFDHIFTSSDMRFIKPEKAAYLHAFEALQVKSDEAVIIDDSPRHTAAARDYGFRAILFEDNTSTIDELTKK